MRTQTAHHRRATHSDLRRLLLRSTSGTLPLVGADGILDVALLVAGDAHRPFGMKGTYEAHAGFLHHTARRHVDSHRLGQHSAYAPRRETPVDQRDRPLCRKPPAPRRRDQAVPELGLIVSVTVARPDVKPT